MLRRMFYFYCANLFPDHTWFLQVRWFTYSSSSEHQWWRWLLYTIKKNQSCLGLTVLALLIGPHLPSSVFTDEESLCIQPWTRGQPSTQPAHVTCGHGSTDWLTTEYCLSGIIIICIILRILRDNWQYCPTMLCPRLFEYIFKIDSRIRGLFRYKDHLYVGASH